MPPVTKIQRKDIIDVTYEIVKEEGMGAVNARKIAKKMNCSIQPIFHNFETMEELKKAVLEKIRHTYIAYMEEGKKQKKAYKGMGLYYIKFAKDLPNFFQLLFMNESKLNMTNYIIEDDIGNDIIKNGMKLTGFSYEEQKKFHKKVWIFTHGLATLVATKTCILTDKEIDELLGTTVLEILKGYKSEE